MSAWAAGELSGRVLDENGLPVSGALVTILGGSLPAAVLATSDEAGRFHFSSLPPGHYDFKVEKQGYYARVSKDLRITAREPPVEVTLHHVQEYEETVNVVYSAPKIDPTESAAQTTLTAAEILDVPYIASHDFRNALPLIPGVVRDNAGRIHLNGAAENQALYTLDGFNITSPVSGILENRISVDALRSVRVESSRYSAEFGKGSAGTLSLESSRGDDHFRFSATNFLPSYEFHNGLTLSNWNPRATISGPIRKGRAWYFNALDLQYDLNVIDSLPSTENTNRNWFGSNLTRVQTNLTPTNLLTLGLLFNFQNSNHFGLTSLDPVETSRNRQERFYLFNLKDQAYLPGGWVLEGGFALNHLLVHEDPQGRSTYRISPQGRSGNYFRTSRSRVERGQWILNLLAPPKNWHGRHMVKFGVDANRIRYHQYFDRTAFEIYRTSEMRARRVEFEGDPRFRRKNIEFGAFVQDQWEPADRIFLELGLRFDWDQILRQPLFSPRVAATWSPGQSRRTKLSAGLGIFHDSTPLGLLTRELDQQRTDIFYDEDGSTLVRGPVRSIYLSEEQNLRAPQFLNWSLGWEQELPRAFFLRSNFIQKRGRNGWTFDWFTESNERKEELSIFRLNNVRRDRYDSLELTLTRSFLGKHPWLLSYTRSSARASAVLDFSLENPVFAAQAGGPLDWDAPNRLISWGSFPAPRLPKFTLSYFLEWHSGFPFNTVDQHQRLVGQPNGTRFPEYFILNLHFERRFRLWRAQWALRAGFNNITGKENPVTVNNNIDSPNFLRFAGSPGRIFTGRIRFLGRN